MFMIGSIPKKLASLTINAKQNKWQQLFQNANHMEMAMDASNREIIVYPNRELSIVQYRRWAG